MSDTEVKIQGLWGRYSKRITKIKPLKRQVDRFGDYKILGIGVFEKA